MDLSSAKSSEIMAEIMGCLVDHKGLFKILYNFMVPLKSFPLTFGPLSLTNAFVQS